MQEVNLPISPKPDNKVFTSYWDDFIEDIVNRDNFKRGHLRHLSILCNLFCELEVLNNVLDFEGHTYESDGGRNGPQIKLRPEVQQRNTVISDIAAYSKLLGVTLMKDMTLKENKKKDVWE
jgi:hypothetical protein